MVARCARRILFFRQRSEHLHRVLVVTFSMCDPGASLLQRVSYRFRFIFVVVRLQRLLDGLELFHIFSRRLQIVTARCADCTGPIRDTPHCRLCVRYRFQCRSLGPMVQLKRLRDRKPRKRIGATIKVHAFLLDRSHCLHLINDAFDLGFTATL